MEIRISAERSSCCSRHRDLALRCHSALQRCESSLSREWGTFYRSTPCKKPISGFTSSVLLGIAVIGQSYLGSSFAFCAGRAFAYGQSWSLLGCSAHDLAYDWPLATRRCCGTERKIKLWLILYPSPDIICGGCCLAIETAWR